MHAIKSAIALLCLILSSALAQTPSDDQIREILIDRIDVQKRSVGIAVGIIDESGRRVDALAPAVWN